MGKQAAGVGSWPWTAGNGPRRWDKARADPPRATAVPTRNWRRETGRFLLLSASIIMSIFLGSNRWFAPRLEGRNRLEGNRGVDLLRLGRHGVVDPAHC